MSVSFFSLFTSYLALWDCNSFKESYSTGVGLLLSLLVQLSGRFTLITLECALLMAQVNILALKEASVEIQLNMDSTLMT